MSEVKSKSIESAWPTEFWVILKHRIWENSDKVKVSLSYTSNEPVTLPRDVMHSWDAALQVLYGDGGLKKKRKHFFKKC